jgi:hypothetical protein
VNLQGRRDDVVEFTRAVGDDSYHRPNRQADQGLYGSRPNAFADQDLVESCQSRSSPDSPEGVGSTHQQVRSSGDTPFSSRQWLPQLLRFTTQFSIISALIFYCISFHFILIDQLFIHGFTVSAGSDLVSIVLSASTTISCDGSSSG